MIRFFYISIHPKFIESYFEFGLFKKAKESHMAYFEAIQLRNFAIDKHGSVDSKPYGGGAGMILRPEPLANAVLSIRTRFPNAQVWLLTPHGNPWSQKEVYEWGYNTQEFNEFIFICGRFEGIDQRFIDLYVNRQISIGPYVITGGELAALTVSDSLLRHLPDLLKSEALRDSNTISKELNHIPQFSRPDLFEGVPVPKEFLSGDPKQIENWKQEYLRNI